MPVTSSPVQASPSLAGWPLPSSRFGADSDSLYATARTVRRAGLRSGRLLSGPPARLHASQAFHMVNSSQFTRAVRLNLTHQSFPRGPLGQRHAP